MKTVYPTQPKENFLKWLAYIDHHNTIEFKTSKVANAYLSWKQEQKEKAKERLNELKNV